MIVVRHGHRDKGGGGEADNGLSAQGRKHAERIRARFGKKFPGEKAALISSPKLRCRETLLPLAESLGVTIQNSAYLDEGGDLPVKCQEFFEAFSRGRDSLVVICTHGDWIPEFLEQAVGSPIELDKGAWAQFEGRAGERYPQLRWLLQKV